MVFGCISKNFLEKIFWCLEKKKENTNQKNTSHKSRKTQIQNNTSKLRLVHSNIFTKNASNQAKETKTQQKKMNQQRATTGAMSDERRPVPSSIAERACRPRIAHRLRRSSIDERCDHPDDRARQSTSNACPMSAPLDRRSHRAISLIAPLNRRSCCAILSIAIVDRTARRHGAIVGRATRSGLSSLSLSLSLSLPLSLFPEMI